MKVRKLVISLLSLSALALAGCSQNSKANEKIVHLTEAQEISTLDSSTVEDTGSSAYIGHMQDPLYWEDENNNVTPALAKEMPEKSEDGLTYTIKMRDDAKWSNGDPITAHDFVYAVQRLANPVW
ncbi:ABC transporter substrate-binding protein [Aerococcus urinae]